MTYLPLGSHRKATTSSVQYYLTYYSVSCKHQQNHMEMWRKTLQINFLGLSAKNFLTCGIAFMSLSQ